MGFEEAAKKKVRIILTEEPDNQLVGHGKYTSGNRGKGQQGIKWSLRFDIADKAPTNIHGE
jgi:hypothetical protein